MACLSGEGVIQIPLEELIENYLQSHYENGDYVVVGVPRFNKWGKEEGELEIPYAFSGENDPRSWAKKPEAVRSWEEE